MFMVQRFVLTQRADRQDVVTPQFIISPEVYRAYFFSPFLKFQCFSHVNLGGGGKTTKIVHTLYSVNRWVSLNQTCVEPVNSKCAQESPLPLDMCLRRRRRRPSN